MVALETAEDVEDDREDVRNEGDANGNFIVTQPRATTHFLGGPFDDIEHGIGTGAEQGENYHVDEDANADYLPTGEEKGRKREAIY